MVTRNEKTWNIPLDQIVDNPWRDKSLYPINKEHVQELSESIDTHDMFGGIKGRHINGKVQIGCGHMRVEAARKLGLASIPIFIDDKMDDDDMLRLMTDENATQSGANPGAVMNEIAAVTRRLIEGLVQGQTGRILPVSIANAFEDKRAIDVAAGRLKKRIADSAADLPLGYKVVQRYLGQGDIKKSHRSETQLREATSALKMSGKYDDLIDDALRKHPLPIEDAIAKTSNKKAVAKTTSKPRRRVLDERCAHLFENEHQFHAFRDAVTTSGAQKILPVNQQYALAESIIEEKNRDAKDKLSKKHTGAPYIRMKVQTALQDAMKKQRAIDKEERDRYLAEQMEANIDAELHSANASLRSLLSALKRMEMLAAKFPKHPKITGFGARLDTLVNAIQQFAKKIK